VRPPAARSFGLPSIPRSGSRGWATVPASGSSDRSFPGHPPHVHFAGTRLLTLPAGPGWIAVGDAAMCWDPVSADGLTLALGTGVDGADALVRELHGEPPRTAYVERLRSATNQFTAKFAGLRRQEQRWPDSDYWQWRLTADP
jgi:flavin-dependent dehydrogenase